MTDLLLPRPLLSAFMLASLALGNFCNAVGATLGLAALAGRRGSTP